MKLTKLSVLFSSLYFGLVGNVFSDSAKLKVTFTETIESVCGFQVSRTATGSILFKNETDAR